MRWLHTDYDYRIARRFYTAYPQLVMFNVTSPLWNTAQVRYRPDVGEIIYVKSTSGKWGKRVRVRIRPDCK